MSFGFLIPTFISSNNALKALSNCVSSLQKYHPTIPKIIFTDPKQDFDIKELDFIRTDPSIRVIETRYCDGEMNVLKHFYETKYFDIGILLHDTFQIKQPLINIEMIEDVNFIWYFTCHRVHWHLIDEPQTEYNIQHKIKTHDDLILHLAKLAYEGTDFYKWFTEIYFKKDEWIGCFGPVSIIRHDFLCKLHEKTNFLDMIPHIKNKRDRIAMESIYALACQYVLGKTADIYDGLYYDGINPNNGYETEFFKKLILYR